MIIIQLVGMALNESPIQTVNFRDTGEDPSQGAHSEFFGEVLAIADDSQDFSVDSPLDEIRIKTSPLLA